jgi:hypothetical protein
MRCFDAIRARHKYSFQHLDWDCYDSRLARLQVRMVAGVLFGYLGPSLVGRLLGNGRPRILK